MLRFLTLLLTTVGIINCVESRINIKFGAETQNGQWITEHSISLPLTVGGKNYFFGIHGSNWFIQELRSNGRMGQETSHGSFKYYYAKAFQYNINGRQFIYCINDYYYWFIQEILPNGVMGAETDRGYWPSLPTIIFPVNVGGEHYVFSLTGRTWFIKKLKTNGQLGEQTDSGSWNDYYTLGFPFSIHGRQYFYCLEDTYWFIQEILPYGKMGKETNNGHWTSNHILYLPISMHGKSYFYGVYPGQKHWFIKELLPGGKMGSEKTNDWWENYYALSFSFQIDGRQYFYGLSAYYWFIQELIQEPSFRLISTDRRKYCNAAEYTVGWRRTKRQINNSTCNVECRGLNFVEEYVTDVRNNDFYHTAFVTSPTIAVTSYSSFRVYADSNHDTAIDLTVVMEATIYRRHIGNARQDISTEVHRSMRRMDRQGDDEAGHLLADSLGGPGATYNFAPQSPRLNRGASVAGGYVPGEDWFEIEGLIRNFIRATNGHVRWSLIVLYGDLQNSRRPTHFLLSIRLLSENGTLINWEGTSAISAYQFSNIPTAACTDFTHPWWNIRY